MPNRIADPFFRPLSLAVLSPLSGLRPGPGLALVVALLLWLPPAEAGQADGEIFSVYLVRHAEKAAPAPDPADPGLSECGRQRAAGLARMLADVGLERIFSTEFRRTLGTAGPVADSLGLEIEIYDPFDLESFSSRLIEYEQNALVVGHSNTTAVLAGLLAGEEGDEFDESLYDRIYQVVVAGGKSRLFLMHQAFDCEVQAD